MPKLDWIGKKAVVNHHRAVPFHLLKNNDDLSVGDPGSGNLWLFGGYDYDSASNDGGYLNDLWRYQPYSKNYGQSLL